MNVRKCRRIIRIREYAKEKLRDALSLVTFVVALSVLIAVLASFAYLLGLANKHFSYTNEVIAGVAVVVGIGQLLLRKEVKGESQEEG